MRFIIHKATHSITVKAPFQTPEQPVCMLQTAHIENRDDMPQNLQDEDIEK